MATKKTTKKSASNTNKYDYVVVMGNPSGEDYYNGPFTSQDKAIAWVKKNARHYLDPEYLPSNNVYIYKLDKKLVVKTTTEIM